MNYDHDITPASPLAADDDAQIPINPGDLRDRVPHDLQEQDCWLLWDCSADAPRRPHWRGDIDVSWTDPRDWHSFDEAVDAAQEVDSWGIGFVLHDDFNGIRGLDLDGCVDDYAQERPADWLPSLEPFIDNSTYIEYSPSGTGLHVLWQGAAVPDWWQDVAFDDRDHCGIEAYNRKFMTITGDGLRDVYMDVEPMSGATVDEWLIDAHEAVTGSPPQTNSGSSGGVVEARGTDDFDISMYDLSFVSEVEYPTGERGSHPVHGSSHGTNFMVDTGRETFRCWRHSCTGNALHLLGVREDIIECGEWTDTDGLSSDTWSEIFDAARDHGLDLPEPDTDTPTPSGDGDGDVAGPAEDWADVRARYLQAMRDSDYDKQFARYAAVKVLLDNHDFITPRDPGVLYYYHDDKGIYTRDGEQRVKTILSRELQAHYSKHERREILDQLESRTYIERDALDGGSVDTDLVCVANGVLDLNTRELLDHSPTYNFVSRVPVEYDPDVDTSRVRSFLEDITREEYEWKTMMEMAGLTLQPGYQHDKFMVLIGEGANGKSTFYNVLEEMLGGSENVSYKSLHQLAESRFATSALDGKMANIDADLSGAQLTNVKRLKNLTGGDGVDAQFKHEDSFRLDNRATLLFAANRPPAIDEQSYAVKRRLVPVHLPYKFTTDPDPDARWEKERDPGLEAELTTDENLSAFLLLALDGLDRLEENEDVSLPYGNDERMERYEKFSDAIKMFRVDALQNEGGYEVPKQVVYDAYTRFCEIEDYSPTSPGAFWRSLRKTTLRVDVYQPQYRAGRIRMLKNVRLSEYALEELVSDEQDAEYHLDWRESEDASSDDDDDDDDGDTAQQADSSRGDESTATATATAAETAATGTQPARADGRGDATVTCIDDCEQHADNYVNLSGTVTSVSSGRDAPGKMQWTLEVRPAAHEPGDGAECVRVIGWASADPPAVEAEVSPRAEVEIYGARLEYDDEYQEQWTLHVTSQTTLDVTATLDNDAADAPHHPALDGAPETMKQAVIRVLYTISGDEFDGAACREDYLVDKLTGVYDEFTGDRGEWLDCVKSQAEQGVVQREYDDDGVCIVRALV